MYHCQCKSLYHRDCDAVGESIFAHWRKITGGGLVSSQNSPWRNFQEGDYFDALAAKAVATTVISVVMLMSSAWPHTTDSLTHLYSFTMISKHSVNRYLHTAHITAHQYGAVSQLFPFPGIVSHSLPWNGHPGIDSLMYKHKKALGTKGEHYTRC